jgi:hypothetical protein
MKRQGKPWFRLLYPVRRSRTARHGQPAGRRTDRNVQSDVTFHDQCGLWNVPLPTQINDDRVFAASKLRRALEA